MCAQFCPVEVPNEFDMGLTVRKAIYIPFPQAVPLKYTIDYDSCVRCELCARVCEAGAIDFGQQPEELVLEVGVIVVATGFDIYLPEDMPELGYRRCADVIVGLELERLLNAAGPTGGHLARPSDGKEPRRVVFIQCVGSRGTGPYAYCSGFCCMYSIKQAILVKEHIPDAEVTILYTDMRTNFKGYEEFYNRAKEMGIKFIRVDLEGREVREDPETGELVIRARTEGGRPVEVRADLVVLASTAIPRRDALEVARRLNIPLGPNGFFMEAHPKLRPVDTAMDGIFLAGACQGLKDIPYSVSQGSAAAARAATILSKDEVESEAITAVVDPELCIGCGLCAEICPYGAPVLEGRKARVVEVLCKGCGTCAASCPRGAITMRHFTDEQIIAQLEALLEAR